MGADRAEKERMFYKHSEQISPNLPNWMTVPDADGAAGEVLESAADAENQFFDF